MATLPFPPLLRSSIGFDCMPLLLSDALGREEDGDRPRKIDYPPYNIEKRGVSQYRIVMALAGFSKDDIEIVAEEHRLTVRGRMADKDMTTYLHRGIAREFERRFDLADSIEVTGAMMADGLLIIDLKRGVPRQLQLRRVRINGFKSAATSRGKLGKRAA
jgi:molecular chaperone IbpA